MPDRSSRRSGGRRSMPPRLRSTRSACVRSGRRRIWRASRGTGAGCSTNVRSRRQTSWSSVGRCRSRSLHGTWSSTASSARPNGPCPTRLAELATLRAEHRARGEDLAAVRRAEAVRQAELETARRRLADVERRATEAAAQVDAAGEQRATVEAVLTAAQHALAEAAEAERRASVAREAARAAADQADGSSRAAAEQERGRGQCFGRAPGPARRAACAPGR